MSGTVLLFGADHDGVLMEVEQPTQPLVFTKAALGRAFWPGYEITADEQVNFERVVYEPRPLRFFDVVMRVHVQAGWPDERLFAQLRDRLLSDKARAAIV